MSSSSLGGRTSTGSGVAIESGRPVPQITGSAKARPFRGGLIVRLLVSGTPNLENSDKMAQAPSNRASGAREAKHTSVGKCFSRQKVPLNPPARKSKTGWYRSAIAPVSSDRTAGGLALGPTDWGSLASRSEE